MSHLPTLPTRPLDSYEEDEVIQHVFQYLPREYIRDVCSLVCFGWSEEATSNGLWKFLAEYDLKIKFDIYETSQTDWRKIYFGLIKSRWRWRRAVSNENIYDVHFKAIILGDKKVGKSSVLMRLVKKDVKKKVIKHYVSKFQMSDICTSLTDVVSKETVRLQFYDSNLPDMADYVKTCMNYATFCHAIIIVFSADKKRTYFNAINKWLSLVQKHRLPCNVFLVANKCDVNQKARMVTTEEATIVAKARGLHYIEMSAANGRNAEDLITSLTNVLYRRLIEKSNYESLWPDLLMAQNGKKDDAIRFFHTVAQIPERKPVKLSLYNNIYTDDEGVSDDEEDELRVSDQQMLESNWMLDQKEASLPWDGFSQIDKQAGHWPGADDSIEESENYPESDDEQIAAPEPQQEPEEEPEEEEEEHVEYEANEEEEEDNGGAWGGGFGRMPIYTTYIPSDDEEEESDSDEEPADPEEGKDAFAGTNEYHPTLNLNSVVREDKGVRTQAFTKTFKRTDTSSLTEQLHDDTKSDRTERVNSAAAEQDNANKRQSVHMDTTGIKDLGTGLADDLIARALEKESQEAEAPNATDKKKKKEECSLQ